MIPPCVPADLPRKRIKNEKAAKNTRGRSVRTAAFSAVKEQDCDEEGGSSGDEDGKEGQQQGAAAPVSFRGVISNV